MSFSDNVSAVFDQFYFQHTNWYQVGTFTRDLIYVVNVDDEKKMDVKIALRFQTRNVPSKDFFYLKGFDSSGSDKKKLVYKIAHILDELPENHCYDLEKIRSQLHSRIQKLYNKMNDFFSFKYVEISYDDENYKWIPKKIRLRKEEADGSVIKIFEIKTEEEREVEIQQSHCNVLHLFLKKYQSIYHVKNDIIPSLRLVGPCIIGLLSGEEKDLKHFMQFVKSEGEKGPPSLSHLVMKHVVTNLEKYKNNIEKLPDDLIEKMGFIDKNHSSSYPSKEFLIKKYGW